MLMSTHKRVNETEELMSPRAIKAVHPCTQQVGAFVRNKRTDIIDVLHGRDRRLLVIVGPCSIHDVDEALIYASELKKLADHYADELLVVFRAYVEKPRSSIGWKGLLSDPDLDGSLDVGKGLLASRSLFSLINSMRLPIATEVLNPLVAPYLDDLISWAAIGARTSESQPHRELASGLPCVIGVKNNTEGNIDVATSAMQSIAQPHAFVSIAESGAACVRTTEGNVASHLVLRGGSDRPNYDTDSIGKCVQQLQAKGLCESLVVDCSHANSKKDHRNQAKVVDEILAQRRSGLTAVKGIMLESNILAGNQPLTANGQLKFGTSITDSCIDMEETELLLSRIAESVRESSNGSIVEPIAVAH